VGQLQPLASKLSSFLATPRGQAYGFATLGIGGLLLGALGLWMVMSGGDNGDGDSLPAASDSDETATATTTTPPATATATATNTPQPTASAPPRRALAPRARPTATPSTLAFSGGGGGGPAPTPTPPPIVAAGDYCDGVGGLNPPSAVYGTLLIGGVAAPAGTPLTVLFDGAAGPSIVTTDAGGYKVLFSSGGGNCANQPAATISISVAGTVVPSGRTVSSGAGGGIRFDISVP
jgi:hypothetical protein